jgi:hypothetical protein
MESSPAPSAASGFVLHPPFLDYHLRLPQRVENLSVQALVPTVFPPSSNRLATLASKAQMWMIAAPVSAAAMPPTNAFQGPGSAMLTGVYVPTPGCWEITGDYQRNKLSFIVWVEPAKSTGQ